MRHTTFRAGNSREGTVNRLEYAFYLVFGDDGSVRLTRTAPAIGRKERSMACVATLPLALFMTPSLKATINVASPEAAASFTVDAEALAEALRGVTGLDVDLRVQEPEQ